MRLTAFVGVAIVLLTSHAFAAEPNLRCAVIADAEVKLRAGPSDQFPETGMLKNGSVVIVEREESGGWLAVSAPQGSISWIAFSFIEDQSPDQPTPKHGIVHSEDGDVTLACGKVGLNQPLDVRREKVADGTQVVLIGPPVLFAGKKWWPIAPPPGDVRYLPKSATKLGEAVNNNFTVRVTDTGGALPASASSSIAPLATIPASDGTKPAGGVTSNNRPSVNHPLWVQAETAEREGRLVDAEKAYFELASIMNGQGGDHDIANLCYTRIHALREKKRGTNTNSTKKPELMQPPAPISKEDRGVRPGTPQPLPPAAKKNIGSTVSSPSNPTGPIGSSTPINPTSPTSANDSPSQFTGTLYRSGVTPDGTGRPAFVLETSPGVPKVYVLAGQGVELEKYHKKRVEVQGVPQTRAGLKYPYVIATSVEPAQ